MKAITELEPPVSVVEACMALAVPRASYYRHIRPASQRPPRPKPARSLAPKERAHVLETLHSEPFVDVAPLAAYATLLEEGRYLCSPRTMYRILEENAEVRERRDQRRHPVYEKPQLLANRPNEVWSWDITKLISVEKWTYYHLYVIIDIFSRYVVAWMVAYRETAALAEKLLAAAIKNQGIAPGQLRVHADRGTSMTSKAVAQLFADLGVDKSHSRPHVSDDNPFSESQFKTLKYHPGFPDKFGSLNDALVHCRRFFRWYNHDHRHSGIAYCTPHDVHCGTATRVIEVRQKTLDAAFAAHPDRFRGRPPRANQLPTAVWINPPKEVGAPVIQLQ